MMPEIESTTLRPAAARVERQWISGVLLRSLLWTVMGAACLAVIHVSAIANGYYQIFYGRFGWGQPEVAFLLHYLLFGTLGAACIAHALSGSVGEGLLAGFDRLGSLSRGGRVALVAATTVVTFAAITAARYVLLRDSAITDDESTYVFMARVFATGRLYLESLPAEVRPFFDNQFIINDGKWYGMYFPGHPLVLAVGALVGAERWIPTVVAILSGLMGYLVSRRMFGPRAAMLCAVLLPLTTYFVLPSATLLSHSTAALALVTFVYARIRIDETPARVRWWFLAGVCLAWAGLTRPLAPPAFALPWVIGLERRLRESGSRRAWAGAALFVALGIAAVGLLCGYNYVLTGDPLETPYHRFALLTHHGHLVGKLPAPWPLPTIYEAGHTILRLNFWEFGWPLSLAFVPFFRRSALAVRLFASTCAVPAAYAVIGMTNVYTLGPTHYSEIAILVCILSASGIEEAVRTVRGWRSGERWARFVVAAPIAGIACMLLVFLPVQGASIREMSELTRAPYDLADEQIVGPAVVLVHSLPALSTPPGTWVYYHRSPRPDLKDRVLFVHYLGASSLERLRPFFPDRRFYTMSVREGRLVLERLDS